MSLLITILQWCLGAVLILIAVVLVSLYIRGAFRRRPLFHINRAIAPQDPRFLTTLKSLTSSLETTGKVIDFWNTADDIQQARLAAIARAQQRIQFETFMMTPGKRADAFADAIARKAVEGVSVQLLVDTYGARALEDSYWQRLRSVGVQIVFFNPFDWRAPANYAGRTHRKLLIVDGDRVLIGGAGISDLWDGTEDDDAEPWLDIEFALTGEVVHLLAAAFQSHWQGHRLKRSGASAIDMEAIYSDLESVQVKHTDRLTRTQSVHSKQPESEDPNRDVTPMLVTLGTNPNYRHSPIETLKQTLIACARQRVWLSSPYLLPNESTRHMLITAQQSGVDVRILTTSVRTDKKPVYYASYEVYGSL
ncbi:MAG: phosphatidylserine/phosphatidylglycerophosphate/cardiolipin synthase family protein, partial [Phormidesmis sp.]